MTRVWVAAVLALVGGSRRRRSPVRTSFRGARVATEGTSTAASTTAVSSTSGAFNGNGGSWRTDYPNADINMSVRLSELTKIGVSKTTDGSPKPSARPTRAATSCSSARS